MSRRMLFLRLVVSISAGLAVGVGFAQSSDEPGSSTSYRFLPRFSVLNESGGFYPRDVDYRIRGTFDFVTSSGNPAVNGWQQHARFENVEAWASHPILAFVLNVDRTLNLSGLKGHQLPVGAPFDVFQFQGETQDGSAVNLLAAQMGPWLRLRGGTTAPPGSADYFEYSIRALARKAPVADFNDDGIVDRGDLTAFTSQFGHGMTGDDFLAWQRQLGETAPTVEAMDAALDAAIAAAGANATAVPEPGSLVLLSVAGVGLIRARRTRRE